MRSARSPSLLLACSLYRLSRERLLQPMNLRNAAGRRWRWRALDYQTEHRQPRDVRWGRAFDAELGDFHAAGQIISQVHQRIAHESIRRASRAAIATMKNHRGCRTRPSTGPTVDQGKTSNRGRTAIYSGLMPVSRQNTGMNAPTAGSTEAAPKLRHQIKVTFSQGITNRAQLWLQQGMVWPRTAHQGCPHSCRASGCSLDLIAPL